MSVDQAPQHTSSRNGLGSVFVPIRLTVIAQLRRVGATVMLVLLPIGFYMALRGQSDGSGLGGLVTASAWANAFAAMFGFRSNRGLDIRLTGAGMGTRTIFFGRLRGFGVIALALSLFLAVFAWLLDDLSISVSLVALLLAAFAAVPIGVLVGVLLPGETEGGLLVLGIFGIPFAIGDEPALKFFPTYGPLEYAFALGRDVQTDWIIHPLVIGVVATAVAAAAWRRALERGTALD